MTNTHNLKVGQKLFYVVSVNRSRNGSNEIWLSVIKVGRKWATLSGYNQRIDLETLEMDGGDYSSPGRCYLSEGEYWSQRELKKCWSTLTNAIHHRTVPDGIDTETIREFAAKCGIEITDAPGCVD